MVKTRIISSMLCIGSVVYSYEIPKYRDIYIVVFLNTRYIRTYTILKGFKKSTTLSELALYILLTFHVPNLVSLPIALSYRI
jgi:hypothetical protein